MRENSQTIGDGGAHLGCALTPELIIGDCGHLQQSYKESWLKLLDTLAVIHELIHFCKRDSTLKTKD